MTTIDRNNRGAWSFEGFVVALTDEIAQRHHDVEDAIFMKIVSLDELKTKIEELFKPHFDKEDRINFQKLKKEDNEAYFLPQVSRMIVNFLNKNLINNSTKNIKKFCKKYSIKKKEDFWKIYNEIEAKNAAEYISFEPGFADDHNRFQRFLKNRVLNSYEVQRMDGRGTYIIRKLLKAYLTNPQQLSDATLVYIENMQKRRTTGRKIVEDLKPLEIGKIREEIDEHSNRASSSFQIKLR